MGETGVTIKALNSEEFNEYLKTVRNSAEDLRVPLGLIAKTQFKFQRQIFQLKSPGKYTDLSDSYKKSKLAKFKFVYPILFASGKLALSLLTPGGNNVLRIGKKTLFYGTKVTGEYKPKTSRGKSRTGIPYPEYLQFGTSKMPERPLLFIDEQRLKTWTNILRDHLKKSFVTKGIK